MRKLSSLSILFSIVALSTSALAGGGEVIGGHPQPMPTPPSKPVPVSDVRLTTMVGCGPHSAHNCPPETMIAFTVEKGSGCHDYSVNAEAKSGYVAMQILDSKIEGCKEPDEMNYESSVSIPGDFTKVKVVITNRIYVRKMYRP